MKLNNKQILILILILNTIKRGWNLGTSLMIINKDLNSKKNLKLLDDIIKNHNKKKNKKETNK